MFTDVKKLMTFVAVVEEGSFTSAADRLNMAQPWVSVQLKQLEELLGVTLIERTKGKFEHLSPSGERLFAIAKKLLASCSQAGEEIKDLRGDESGTLVLGVDPITLYIPERNQLIKQFLANAPEVEMRIVSRNPTELFNGLEKGEFDMILTSTPEPQEGLHTLPLYAYDLKLAVPKSAADRYSDDLQSADLLTLPNSYHPLIFSWLQSTLRPAGVTWHECPEASFPALLRYSSLLNYATLVPDFGSSIPELHSELEVRPTTGYPLQISWGLMKRAGYRRKGPERFWHQAANSSIDLRPAFVH